MTAPDGGGKVRAAGGVLWRAGPDGLQVAVVHRPRYDDWSLPKGKTDPGEHPAVTAQREVLEETGCFGVLGRRLLGQTYQVTGPGGVLVDKVVEFWAMRLDADAPLDAAQAWPRPDEVDEVRWLTPAKASRMLTREADRRTLDSFADGPAATTTVALIRHGSAGNKKRWSGTDERRPLDDRGRLDAQRIADVLPVFGFRRAISAPITRCTATIQPLAARLAVPIELAEAVGEEGNPTDIEPARALLAAVVASGVPAAICSQGGVIPELLETLAESDGVPCDAPRSRKGSTWLLSFDGDRLVAADYFEDLAAVRD